MEHISGNPNPWPSFDNMSGFYAGHLNARLNLMVAVATYIQRWHRKELDVKPIDLKKVLHCLGAENITKTPMCAYEKVDGSNFGVREDGLMFGRRARVTGASYQKVPVGVAPSGPTVIGVKRRIAELIQLPVEKLPLFTIYGEMMCNFQRYGYNTRGLHSKFLAFGAVFDACESLTTDELCRRLDGAEFLYIQDTENDRVKITANPQFMDIMAQFGILTVPFKAQGGLMDVCVSLEEYMKSNTCEGVVLSGPRLLKKWKTGAEDESNGAFDLEAVLLRPEISLVRQEEVELARLLLRVVSVRAAKPGENKERKEQKIAATSVYEGAIITRAMMSALSKYDCVESYFERPSGSKDIKQLLVQEVVADLAATTNEQVKCIDMAVSKHIGIAYSQWSKSKK